MKRLIVLCMVLAIFVVGVAALADPMNVGGSFTTSMLSPIHGGGSNNVPPHAVAWGLHAKLDVAPMVMLSPMNVGGS